MAHIRVVVSRAFIEVRQKDYSFASPGR